MILEAIQTQASFYLETFGKDKQIKDLLDKAASQERMLVKDVETIKANVASNAKK